MRQSGYVLFTVLIFIQVFAALGWYGMGAVVSSIKATRQTFFRSERLHNAQAVMHELAGRIVNLPANCLIPVMARAELMKMSNEWWERYACHDKIGKLRYYFVIESLGLDMCAEIIQSNQPLAAEYYRITLYKPHDHSSGRILLQSTVAVPGQTGVLCNEQIHHVIAGQQVLREW